ncbi:MAG TPA: VOC family protein [Candidatus Kapabacteria bacterium]|nr:VOC family protein [Candidatus Kapabacteria bacterium]
MNPVIHFEMPYENQDRMTAFYGAAFGWQLQGLGEQMGNYVLATTTPSNENGPTSPGAINGGFFPRSPDGTMQQPSLVVSVNNLQESMAKVTGAGGTVLGEPVDIPGVGKFVAFTDTEGNRASMLEPLPRG